MENASIVSDENRYGDNIMYFTKAEAIADLELEIEVLHSAKLEALINNRKTGHLRYWRKSQELSREILKRRREIIRLDPEYEYNTSYAYMK